MRNAKKFLFIAGEF